MSRYQYGALDRTTREIRVFRLQPADRRDRPVFGNLIPVSLDQQPKYDALSYVWGAPQPAVDIIVDGLSLSIGPNLQNALLDLRQARTPLLLWIDAICINQANLSEREHQVGMMRDIYSQADLVRGWLNEHVDPTAKPFKEIQRLRRRSPATFGPLNFRAVMGIAGELIPYLFYSATGIRRDLKSDHAFWEPVIRVFDNEYRARLWIQQEILLARQVVFHCREHAIPGKGLFRFQAAIWYHNVGVENGDSHLGSAFEMNVPGYFSTLSEGREHVAFTRRARDAGGAEREPSLFFRLFLDSCNLRVTDPRDRVYGCLGLLGEKQQRHVTVDYSFDLVQTYAQVFRSHTREYGNLDFICSSIGSDSVDAVSITLPVWMPTPEKGSVFFYQELERRNSAPSTSEHVGVISADGTVLTVTGFQVDTVHKAGNLEPILHSPILGWVEEVQALNSELNPHEAPDALWEKPDVGELFRYGCSDDTYWSIWYRRPPTTSDLTSVLGNIVRSPVESGIRDLSLAKVLEGTTDKRPDSDIIISMCEAVKRSSFFMSGSQHLGLISRSNSHLRAEGGDLIFKVQGCPKLLVLRPSDAAGRRFLLIGSVVLPQLDAIFQEPLSGQNGAHKGAQGVPVVELDLI